MILNKNELIENIENNKIIVKNEHGNTLKPENITINPNSIDVQLHNVFKTYVPFIKLEVEDYSVLLDYDTVKKFVKHVLLHISSNYNIRKTKILNELENEFNIFNKENLNKETLKEIEKTVKKLKINHTKIYNDTWKELKYILIKNTVENYKTKTLLNIEKELKAFEYKLKEDEKLLLLPGILYLGVTKECIGSEYFVPMYEGRSSTGRLGLSSHVTAGFGDIGYIGYWTLEIWTLQPLIAKPGMRIGQVYFYKTNLETIDNNTLYKGKYKNQNIKPIPYESKIYKDFQN